MKKFIATKVSGYSACVFGASIVTELCRIAPQRIRFSLPFLGFTLRIDAHHHGDEWINDDAYRRGTQSVLSHIRRHGIGYFNGLAKQIAFEATVFFHQMRRLHPLLRTMNDSELIRQYRAFIKLYTHTMSLGICTFLYEGFLSERLVQSLGERYRDVGALLGVLLKSSYKSYMVRNEAALRSIRKARNANQRRILVADYLNKWFFVDTNFFYAPILTAREVLHRARLLTHASRKQSTRRHIRLTPEERRIVELLRVTEVIHDQRKRINQIGGFVLFRFLDEAVRRTGIPRSVAQNAFWFEYEDLMLHSRKFRRRLERRKFVSVVYANRKTLYSETNLVIPKRIEIGTSVIHGTPASSGRVTGSVRIVLGHRQFPQFKKGEILVSEMTRPDFVQVLKKAAAIVTDEGGITCHAAVVSRELGIPCIVGTKIATQVLKDGERVEVDAIKGVVKKL